MKKFLFTALISCATLLTAQNAPKIFKITQDFKLPTPLDQKILDAQPAPGATPKNVILIIGDGMGQGSHMITSYYGYGKTGQLLIENLPASGFCTTHCHGGGTTDSAASGTALSSGYKTYNGALGMNLEKQPRPTIAEVARDAGLAVGIMTTDNLTGATPSAFSTHVAHRSLGFEIAENYAKCNFNLIIGANDKAFKPKADGGLREDDKNIITDMQAAGYTRADTLKELKNLPAETKVIGFPTWPNELRLSEFTEVALDRLSKASDKGFFTMIESSWPDHGGHSNEPNLTVKGVAAVEFTAKTAIEFAAKRGDTLVIITADHETGKAFATLNKQDPKHPHITYQSTGHSLRPVPIFAYGPGAELFNGPMDNIDVPKKIAALMKLDLPN